MSDKILCPKCKSELFFWVVPVMDELRKINPKTGEISKTTTIINDGYTDQCGFQCQNENCKWISNIVSDSPINDVFESWADEHYKDIADIMNGRYK